MGQINACCADRDKDGNLQEILTKKYYENDEENNNFHSDTMDKSIPGKSRGVMKPRSPPQELQPQNEKEDPPTKTPTPIPTTNFGKSITEDEMLSKVSENVMKTEKDLAIIIPTNEELMAYPNTKLCGPTELKDGSVYHGSWNSEGKRGGFGNFVKADGSKFSGFWKNNFHEGRGRFIDKNGNYYEGI